MTFEVLAHADQPLTGTNEDAHALRSLAADMNLSKPTRSRQLSQSFSVALIGFVNPTRQRLVCQTCIYANNRHPTFLQFAGEPNR